MAMTRGPGKRGAAYFKEKEAAESVVVEIKEEPLAEYVCAHCSGTGYTTTKQQPLVVAPKKPSAFARGALSVWGSVKSGAKWAWNVFGGIVIVVGVVWGLRILTTMDTSESTFKADIKSCSPYLKSSSWDEGNCNCLVQKELLNPKAKASYDEAEARLCPPKN